jgi:RNA polymerase sigma-70 factor (ECF subfamily)
MPDSTTEVARWLAAVRAGSQEALGRALAACRGYLLLVAQRELGPELQAKAGPSDLVQETLMDAVRDFARFQGKTEDELLQWLRRLLLNNLIDFTRHYRDTARRQVDREGSLLGDSSVRPVPEPAAALPSPSDEVLAREEAKAVERALRELPENYRHVVLWRYQEGRSFEAIGKALGITANAARKLLLRAIRRVQQELGEP